MLSRMFPVAIQIKAVMGNSLDIQTTIFVLQEVDPVLEKEYKGEVQIIVLYVFSSFKDDGSI